jgi:hypothetical protein
MNRLGPEPRCTLIAGQVNRTREDQMKLMICCAAAIAIAAAASVVTASGARGGHGFETAVATDGISSHYFTSTKAPNAEDIYGRIESSKRKCRVGRHIDVFRKVAGPDTNLGSDTSDSNGGWSLMVPLEDLEPASTYYAKAPRLNLANGDFCDRDRSPDLLP